MTDDEKLKEIIKIINNPETRPKSNEELNKILDEYFNDKEKIESNVKRKEKRK